MLNILFGTQILLFEHNFNNLQVCHDRHFLPLTNVIGFGKISHFVTFVTSNIYGQNNALYSTSQPYSEYRVSVYTELPLKYFNRNIRTVMVT